jgi:hypothetical protein
MTAVDLLRKAYQWGPLLFGIGFIAPLCAQTLQAASIQAPLGVSPVAFGLAVGIVGGTIAKIRGSWI